MRKHRKSFRSLRFLKYKKFSLGRFLLFLKLRLKSAGLHSWKCKKCFLFRKYNKIFLLTKYRKSFSLWKYKIFFNIRAKKSHFWKNKECSWWRIFLIFLGLGWEVQGSIFGNIRKDFFWENIRKAFFFYFFRLGLGSSISLNIRKYKIFFNISAREFHFPKYIGTFSG